MGERGSAALEMALSMPILLGVSAGVVEFGNALYQPVVDRFVNGEASATSTSRRSCGSSLLLFFSWSHNGCPV